MGVSWGHWHLVVGSAAEVKVGYWLQQTNNVSNVAFHLPSAPVCLELKGGC